MGKRQVSDKFAPSTVEIICVLTWRNVMYTARHDLRLSEARSLGWVIVLEVLFSREIGFQVTQIGAIE